VTRIAFTYHQKTFKKKEERANLFDEVAHILWDFGSETTSLEGTKDLVTGDEREDSIISFRPYTKRRSI